MKYAVLTFGCRVNQSDSLEIEERLLASGAVCAPPECADLVVVNTCSVTATADQGARQTIRRVARENPEARIFATGCYATRCEEELAALPNVYPRVPVQRCWAHKIRNILNKVRVADQPAVKRGLHKVMNADTRPQALAAARRFADRFEEDYPKAVACLRDDLDDLLTCFRYKTLKERRRVRTTNAIERRFREVRRRTRPMGVFQDRTSMDRILFAVFTRENKSQSISSLFLLTQTF